MDVVALSLSSFAIISAGSTSPSSDRGGKSDGNSTNSFSNRSTSVYKYSWFVFVSSRRRKGG